VEGAAQGSEAREGHEVRGTWQQQADAIARQVGVPPALFKSIIRHESGGNPKARSPAGAIGYTQLMPGTARALGVNPHNPYQNLLGGARYLKRQLAAYNGNVKMALAAYNAGPGAVAKYHGVPPYAETQAYVRNVMRDASIASGAPSTMSSNVFDIGRAAPQGLDPAASLKRRQLRAALTPDPGIKNILQRSVGERVADSITHEIPLPQLAASISSTTPGGLPAIGTMTPAAGPWKKFVKLGPRADRAGTPTQAPVLAFVGALGKRARRRLEIGTGTNHSRLTVDGNVSNHWNGMAADVPAKGRELRRLGYLALLQAGMSPQQARKARQTGGLFNVGKYQVIFATNEGGDHYDHLHVGVRD